MASQAQGRDRWSCLFPLHDLAARPLEWAVFLDIDGTLLEIAETPNAIAVPPALPADLDLLSQHLGGALALVTGRSVAFVDSLFSPIRFTLAGLHGAEWRHPDGHVRSVVVSSLFEELKRAITDEVGRWPGALVEDKGAAIAVHYRLAPERRHDVEEMMQRYATIIAPDWTLQHGKMVTELRPASANKGNAVEAILACQPFNGRRPIVVGDDLTDEAMFRVANARKGKSIRIGSLSDGTSAHYGISTPADLRRLLATLVE